MRMSVLVGCVAMAAIPAAVAAPGPVILQPYASGFTAPLEIVHAGDGSGRLFVVEQAGRIRIVRGGQVLATPFLDITSKVLSGGEEGLLGLAFHPSYASNGRFFVYYNRTSPSPDGGSQIVIEEYHRSASNPDVADAAGIEKLTIAHPTFTNHNGGKLAFRPGETFLYAGVGDGGGGGNPFHAAENLGDLRGKLLRIDVDHNPPDLSTNPFANTPGARAEVWAFGLRNPFRFSFDRRTGDLYIGDVGQNLYEEVDYVPASAGGGQDFGWSTFEGFHCYDPPTGCARAGAVPPVLEYGHDASGGIAITGGYRYRGPVRELQGFYVYGDFGSGRIWAAQPMAGGAWGTTQVATASNLSAFGEDEAGELYVANLGAGTISRLAAIDSDGDGMSDAFETQYFGSATAGDPTRDDDGDGLSNLVEYREGRNPLVKDNDVFADARLFTMQQYRDFLAREGDPLGIEFWTQRLEGGTQTRVDLAQSFLDSPEFGQAIAPIVRLYLASFARVPDAPGLRFWTAQFKAGMPLPQVAEAFAQSDEFLAVNGMLDDGAFVDRLYRVVLGREPDMAGRNAWVSQLASGTLTRGQVMLGFSESTEYQATSRPRVLVTMAYVGMLRRSPEPGGFDFWVGYLGMGNAEPQLIAQFIAAPEYRNRFLP
jgi:glucose/arabinose dehydrogenase